MIYRYSIRENSQPEMNILPILLQYNYSLDFEHQQMHGAPVKL